MKISWIKRWTDKNNSFTTIAKTVTNIDDFSHFFSYKNDIKYLPDHLPLFYKQVFTFWYELYSTVPKAENDILNEKIWYNKNILIQEKPIHYKKWENKGIVKLNDLFNLDGTFKTIIQLQNQYELQIDLMKYNGIKSAIPKPWLKKIKRETEFVDRENYLTVSIRNIDRDIRELKTKGYYWELVTRKEYDQPVLINGKNYIILLILTGNTFSVYHT